MFAIVNLIILSDKYIVGSLITNYIHRAFFKKYSIQNISLVCMTTNDIYNEHKQLLEVIYDKVCVINLIEYVLDEKYKYNKGKYYSWMSKSCTKWNCLKLEEFEKVLFMDIDILVNHVDFYSIFSIKTPATHSITNSVNNIKDMVNGGLLLLSPSSKEFYRFIQFSKELFKNGAYSPIYGHGIDEFSIYSFYKYKWKLIDSNYTVVPWKDSIKNSLSYNFLSAVKPWNKRREMCFSEELLWFDILDIVVNEDKYKVFIDIINYLTNKNIQIEIDRIRTIGDNSAYNEDILSLNNFNRDEYYSFARNKSLIDDSFLKLLGNNF